MEKSKEKNKRPKGTVKCLVILKLQVKVLRRNQTVADSRKTNGGRMADDGDSSGKEGAKQ